MGTPAAEIDINPALVKRLLKSQHSDLAHLPIVSAGTGWDNAMFRLGEQWALRLPRRQLGAKLVEKEQTWLWRLAPHLTIPVSVPLRVGQPEGEYPWRWSVVPWIVGETVDSADLRASEALRLAEFLRSLHMPAPAEAPTNPFRGCSLSERDPSVQQWMQALDDTPDALTPQIKALWNRAVSATCATERRWLHGDLHPRNIVAKDGVITGVSDWADLCSGDEATDLAVVWMVFDQACDRATFISAYGIDAVTELRSKGWAIFFATILLKTGLVDNPRHAAMGRNTMRRLAQG